MSRVIYMRVGDDLHAEIKRVAGRCGVPINYVAEVLLRRGLGVPYDPTLNPLHRVLAELEKPRQEDPQ